MLNLDIVIILLFAMGMASAVLANRIGKRWLLMVAIVTTVAVGLRALFLFEFGSGLMATIFSALFLAGVVTSWLQVERLQDESKG